MKTNVHLTYSGGLPKVKNAILKANEILSSANFYAQIRAYKKFDNSDLSPEVISRLMQESGHEIKVEVNWFMPVYAGTDKFSDRILLSGWEFSPNLALGVNTLIHETVHVVDCLYDILQKETKQKNHRPVSAPWVIASIAQLMTLQSKENPAETEASGVF